jgi:hypothetical protein
VLPGFEGSITKVVKIGHYDNWVKVKERF